MSAPPLSALHAAALNGSADWFMDEREEIVSTLAALAALVATIDAQECCPVCREWVRELDGSYVGGHLDACALRRVKGEPS